MVKKETRILNEYIWDRKERNTLAKTLMWHTLGTLNLSTPKINRFFNNCLARQHLSWADLQLFFSLTARVFFFPSIQFFFSTSLDETNSPDVSLREKWVGNRANQQKCSELSLARFYSVFVCKLMQEEQPYETWMSWSLRPRSTRNWSIDTRSFETRSIDARSIEFPFEPLIFEPP